MKLVTIKKGESCMKSISCKNGRRVVCWELLTRKLLQVTCLLMVVINLPIHAKMLSSKSWKVLDNTKQQIKGIADNNIETSWTSKDVQYADLAIEIDLGKLASIHRIYMTPGNNKSDFPRSLRISFQRKQTYSPFLRASRDKSSQFSIAPSIIKANLIHYREVNLKFNPVIARYIYVEIGGETAGLPWSIAELELYGTYNKETFKNKDAVVLPDNVNVERAMPIDSPSNAEIKRRLSIWPQKAKEFQHYGYCVDTHKELSRI